MTSEGEQAPPGEGPATMADMLFNIQESMRSSFDWAFTDEDENAQVLAGDHPVPDAQLIQPAVGESYVAALVDDEELAVTALGPTTATAHECVLTHPGASAYLGEFPDRDDIVWLAVYAPPGTVIDDFVPHFAAHANYLATRSPEQMRVDWNFPDTPENQEWFEEMIRTRDNRP